MLLGLGVDVWNKAQLELPMAQIRLAEQLGFDSIWTAEIYGADAITPLAFIAAHTEHIRLGTAVIQVAARPPVTTAMQMGTLDALAPGRAIVGLGLSGPQIVEGWYGQAWGSPNAKLRDYVSIMKQVFRREGPVAWDGKQIQLPYRGPDALGVGKPLKSILHMNPDIPILLASGGPANVALMAELADGWLPLGYTPDSAHLYEAQLATGVARRTDGKTLDDLEIHSGCTVRITDDVKGAIHASKTQFAFLVGGYGTREHNFHRDAMVRRGYGDAAERVQELFLAGRRDEAVDAVPDDYIDDGALIGSEARIRERFERWTRTRATSLTIRGGETEMRLMADIVGARPRQA
jgi:F420-dependent oxidoreductase-like protein